MQEESRGGVWRRRKSIFRINNQSESYFLVISLVINLKREVQMAVAHARAGGGDCIQNLTRTILHSQQRPAGVYTFLALAAVTLTSATACKRQLCPGGRKSAHSILRFRIHHHLSYLHLQPHLRAIAGFYQKLVRGTVHACLALSQCSARSHLTTSLTFPQRFERPAPVCLE